MLEVCRIKEHSLINYQTLIRKTHMGKS